MLSVHAYSPKKQDGHLFFQWVVDCSVDLILSAWRSLPHVRMVEHCEWLEPLLHCAIHRLRLLPPQYLSCDIVLLQPLRLQQNLVRWLESYYRGDLGSLIEASSWEVMLQQQTLASFASKRQCCCVRRTTCLYFLLRQRRNRTDMFALDNHSCFHLQDYTLPLHLLQN